MKPCGRHGGYKVARRWVPSEMLQGGQGGTQMPSGVSLRERRKGGKTFCSYFVSIWKKKISTGN